MTGNHANRPSHSEAGGSMPQAITSLQHNVLLQSEMVRAVVEKFLQEGPVTPPATAP